jgi:hypothetical protein
MVWKEIPRVCFCFCSSERNSELFSLPRKGSDRNSESTLLFLFHGKEFRVVFSSAEGFGTEFRDYASIFVPRNGIPSCFLFRGRVRNGIPEVSVPRNSRNSVENKHFFRLFRVPRNYFFVGNSQPYVEVGDSPAAVGCGVSLIPIPCTAKIQYRKFKANITRKGIVRLQSKFPNSCVSERFIYSQMTGLSIMLQENMWTDLGNI